MSDYEAHGDSELTHLHPGESVHLTAVVTNCHADAYLGCTWHGGEGISFSDAHSLTTTVTYASSSQVQWSTNNAYLVTSYAGGYCVTNANWFTVGMENEPTPAFSIGCQEVFFLNDADVLDGGATNRPERIRPVTLNLLGPYGTNGTVKLSAQGSASPVMFYIDNGVTNLITETTEIPLEVTDPFARTGTNTFYVSCSQKGTGTISATLELEGGRTHVAAAGFKCIEPLRQLVTTERTADGHRFINPSRLVMGTNAVLRVGVQGDFAPSEVKWREVSGPGRIVATNGFEAVVEPTGTNGDFIVEARFNDDEIQPRFVLPVVEERVLHVRAFAVTPPESLMAPSWDRGEIETWFQTANEIYSQVGIRFVLDEVRLAGVGTNQDWVLWSTQYKTRADGSRYLAISDQTLRLLTVHPSNDCIRVFFLGTIEDVEAGAFTISPTLPYQGVFIGRMSNEFTLAHELGHALWLDHCRSYRRIGKKKTIFIEHHKLPVTVNAFPGGMRDWGMESGRGFYSVDDTLERTLEKLVMFGATGNDKMDIPDYKVISLTATATNSTSVFYSNVGARHMQTEARKVYDHEN